MSLCIWNLSQGTTDEHLLMTPVRNNEGYVIVAGGTSPSSLSGQMMDVTTDTIRMAAMTVREAKTGTWKKSSMSIP